MLADGGCRVADNGRGIPVDNHPEYKGKSAAEVVLTVLHAGGKFGGEGYKISGGLHGVGVSVVNALSSRLDLEIHRDGGKWEQHYAKGGKPQDKLTKVAAVEEARHDDHVLARPDDLRGDRVPRADAPRAPARDGVPQQGPRDPLPRRARRSASLEQTFKYAGGIVDFVQAPQRVEGAAVQAGRRRIEDTGDDYEVDIAMQWNTGYYEGIHSFANNIATTEGGMHEEGFKKALTNVVNRYAKGKGLLKEKDDNLLGEDIREGLTAIISVKLREPAVRGPDQDQARQHRDAVAGREGHQREARRLARGAPDRGPAGGRRRPRRPRRPAWRRARRATSRGASRCSSRRRCRASSPTARRRTRPSRELFIVEGDSAGGSAKRARDPRTQAILPIRGKILNVERARLDQMLKNEEIQALITAIGAGIGDEFDVEKLRYHKIVIMADADVDGSHIRTLLLTFFYRQLAELVQQRLHLHRAAAAVPRRHRQGAHLPQGRSRAARVRGRARGPQDRGQPVQGPRRDGLAGARRDHDGPGHAHAAPGVGRGGRHRRRGLLQAHGRRRRVAARASSRQNAKDVRFLDV